MPLDPEPNQGRAKGGDEHCKSIGDTHEMPTVQPADIVDVCPHSTAKAGPEERRSAQGCAKDYWVELFDPNGSDCDTEDNGCPKRDRLEQATN